MPGFRQSLVSLVVCQHFYLVANAKERNMPLKSIEGEITIITGKDWIMKSFEGDFVSSLDAPKAEWETKAKPEGLQYCMERMKLCPVSKNLAACTDKKIEVRFMD